MAIIAKNTGNNADFAPIEAGSYVARCVSMTHIGTMIEKYMGDDKLMNKVRFDFELPTELKVFNEEKGEQPYMLGRDFSLSLHEKANLRKFLAAWRGKDFTEEEAASFDITKLLGVTGMANVIHQTSKDGKVYAAITSMSAIPKGMVCPPQINPSFEFGYTPFSQEAFDKLPQWLKDKVVQSNEYKELFDKAPVKSEPKKDDDFISELNKPVVVEDDGSELPF